MKANIFFWRPVMTGLLSFTEVQEISFIDLVHAHEVIDFKEETQGNILQMIGDSLGR